MQFENVEKFNTKGEKKDALQGYIEIYKSDESTIDAKKNAAYNISVLFHELGNMELMFGWLNRAVSMMNPSEILKFSSSFLVMISDLNNQGRFKKAHRLYSSAFEKMCTKKNKLKNAFLQNSITIELMDSNVSLRKPKTLINDLMRCRISSKVKIKLLEEVVDYYIDKNLIENLELIYENYRTDSTLLVLKSRLAGEIAFLKNKSGDAKANEYFLAAKAYYRKLVKKKIKPDYRVLFLISNHELAKIQKRIAGFSDFNFSFPRNKFANLMTRKFKEIARFKKSIENLYDYGVGDTIIAGNKLLLEAYKQFIKKINEFSPKGFSQENLKLFRKEMQSVVRTLEGDKNTIFESSVSLIKKQRILSRSNQDFLIDPSIKEYVATPMLRTVIMDRFGRQQ